MSRFVRASKVRHVFCDPPKPETCYQNLKLSTATGDHNYIKGNTKYIAVPIASGGGSLAVISYDNTGKQGAQPPCLDGHKGPVLDFDFNPFHDQIIATGGDDAHLMIWGIPPNGLEKTMSEPLVDLQEHQRKITVMNFHPTAEHVLATGSADQEVKIWDVEAGACKTTISHNVLLQDVVWSYTGSQLLTSAKDKKVRLVDPRNGEVSAEVEGHQGTKTCKMTWLGDSSKFLTCGFTRQSKRQFKIWDSKKMDKEICTADIDQAAGVIMPFFDEDTNILFLAGKGDGNVRCFELVNEDPYQFGIYEYRATTPCRGMAITPKRGVNVMKCEVAKLLKLSSNAVEPLHFIIPRKSDLFQADLFPDGRAGKSAISAADFFGGKEAKPVRMSLDPKKRKDGGGSSGGVGMKIPKTAAQLNAIIAEKDKEIAALKKKLKDAGIDA